MKLMNMFIKEIWKKSPTEFKLVFAVGYDVLKHIRKIRYDIIQIEVLPGNSIVFTLYLKDGLTLYITKYYYDAESIDQLPFTTLFEDSNPIFHGAVPMDVLVQKVNDILLADDDTEVKTFDMEWIYKTISNYTDEEISEMKKNIDEENYTLLVNKPNLPQKRVFKIDVGKDPSIDVKKIISDMRDSIKKIPYVDDNKEEKNGG